MPPKKPTSGKPSSSASGRHSHGSVPVAQSDTPGSTKSSRASKKRPETPDPKNSSSLLASSPSKGGSKGKKKSSEVVSVDITTETTQGGKTTTTHRRRSKVNGKMQDAEDDKKNEPTLKDAVEGGHRKRRHRHASEETTTTTNPDGSKITKTVRVKRRRRKGTTEKGEVVSTKVSGEASGKTKRRGKRVVKKVVIKKHRHSNEVEEPEPEPIIKRIRRKKTGVKKIVKKVVIKKRRHGGKASDETLTQLPDEGGKKKGKGRRRRKATVTYVTVVKTRINPKTGKKEKYEEKVPVEPTAEDGKKKKRVRRKGKSGASAEAAGADAGGAGKKKLRRRRGTKTTDVDGAAAGDGKKKKIVRRRKKVITKIIKIVRRKVNPKTGKEELVEEPIPVKISVNASDPPNVQNEALEKAAMEVVEKRAADEEKKNKKKGPKKNIVRKLITVVRKVVNPQTGKEELVEEKRMVEAEIPENATPEVQQQAVEDLVLEATTKAAEKDEEAAQKKDKKRKKRRIVHRFVSVVKKVINPETGKEELVEEKSLVAASVPEDMSPEQAIEAIQEVAKEAVQKQNEDQKSSSSPNDTQLVQTFVNVVQKVTNPETGEEQLVEEMKLVAAEVKKDTPPEIVAQQIDAIATESMNQAAQIQEQNEAKTHGKRRRRRRICHKIISIVRKRINPETGKEELIEEKKVVAANIDDSATPEQIAEAIQNMAMEATTKAQDEHEETLAQIEAKQEGTDIAVVRKRRRRKRKVIVQKFITVVKKQRNPKTGVEELVSEKKLVTAELPPESPPEAAASVIQEMATEAIVKAAEKSGDKSGKKLVPNFVTVVKKHKDPETGKVTLVEETQLIAAQVPKDTTPEEASAAVEELATQAMCKEAEDNGDIAPGHKLAHHFVTVLQKERNPDTGIEEVVEKKQLVTTEVPKHATPEAEAAAIEEVAAQVLEKAAEEKQANFDPEKEVEITEYDKETGKLVKKKVKPKKKKVAYNFVKVVKKRMNPITGKEEIFEEKQLVAAEVPIDSLPTDAQAAIEEVAAEAIEKAQEEKDVAEAIAAGEPIITEVNKKTGRVVRRRRKPKKRIVHRFVTQVKRQVNPLTGKEELVEEKQLVAAEVDLETPPEQAAAAIETLAAEAIQKEAEDKEKAEDLAALASGETDEARKKRKAKKKKFVHNFVNVVKRKVNPETGKEELVEEKQLVTAEVPNDIPEDQVAAVIEQLAAEHIEKVADDEQKAEAAAYEKADPEAKKKMKLKKKKKAVHNFVTVVKKKVNPTTGKEELVEEKQLVTAEIDEDTPSEEAAKVIEAMAAEAINLAVEKNQKEEDNVAEMAAGGKGDNKKAKKKKVVHNFVNVTKQRINPTTGKKETYQEKQLVAIEVPEDVPVEEAKKQLEVVKKEQAKKESQKSSTKYAHKIVPIKKTLLNLETGKKDEYVDQVQIEFPEGDAEAEKEEVKKAQEKADQEYKDQKAVYAKIKLDKEKEEKEESVARKKAAEEEKKRQKAEAERIKLAKKDDDYDEYDYEEEEDLEETHVIIEYSDSEQKPKKKPVIIHEYYYEEEDEEEELEVHNITVYVDDNGQVLSADTKVQGADGKEIAGDRKFSTGVQLGQLLNEINPNGNSQSFTEVEYGEKGTVYVKTLQQDSKDLDPKTFDPTKYGLSNEVKLEITPKGTVLIQEFHVKPGEEIDPSLIQGLQLSSLQDGAAQKGKARPHTAKK